MERSRPVRVISHTILAWYTRKTRKSWCKQYGGVSGANLQHSADDFSRLSFVGGGGYSFNEWCRRWVCIFVSYLYFLSAQISENCELFRNHGSSLSLRWLQEPFSDDILDIWITCSIVIIKWAYPKGKCIWEGAYWSKKADSCDCMGPGEPRDLPSHSGLLSSVSRCIGRVVRALVDVRTDLFQWPRGNNLILVFIVRENHRWSTVNVCREYANVIN